MNKKINKIIISIVCVIILAIVGFSIYSMNTKNTSTEVTEEKQEPVTVKEGDEPKTDIDTELTDQDKEGMSAVNVFMQGFQEVFNVENTKTINVDNYNFLTENGKKAVENFYGSFTTSTVGELNIIKVVSKKETTEGKTGYLIYYKNKLTCDNKEDLVENAKGLGFASAWVCKDNDNVYRIDSFGESKITTLDE